MLIDGLGSLELLVDFCNVYISCLDSSFWRYPFTAGHPLASNWYNAKFLKICYSEETNSTTSWMDGLRVNTYSASFHFGWTIPKIADNSSKKTVLFALKLCFIWVPTLSQIVSSTIFLHIIMLWHCWDLAKPQRRLMTQTHLKSVFKNQMRY